MLFLSIGHSILSIDLTSDLKECILEIGDDLAAMKNLNAPVGIDKHCEIKQKFMEYVNFYSEAKALSMTLF